MPKFEFDENMPWFFRRFKRSIGSRLRLLYQIRRFFTSGNWGVRHIAIQVLKGIAESDSTNPELLTYITELVNYKDSYVRASVIEALGEMSSIATKPELFIGIIHLLEDKSNGNPSSEIRNTAFVALKKLCVNIDRPEMINIVTRILTQRLTSKYRRIRKSAVSELVNIDTKFINEEIVDCLCKLIYDRNPSIGLKVINILVKFGIASPEVVTRTAQLFDRFQYDGLMKYILDQLMAKGFRLFRRQPGKWEIRNVLELSSSD